MTVDKVISVYIGCVDSSSRAQGAVEFGQASFVGMSIMKLFEGRSKYEGLPGSEALKPNNADLAEWHCLREGQLLDKVMRWTGSTVYQRQGAGQ